jgi:hypothetical protein
MADRGYIDYAHHLIKIEAETKKIYDLCLDKKYDDCQEKILHTIVELRMLAGTLSIMHEKELARKHPQ